MITMQVKVKGIENYTLYSAVSFHMYVFSCFLHAEYYGLNSVQAVVMRSSLTVMKALALVIVT